MRRCPKCGRPVTEADVICPGCDFVLDTSFLGEDITDDRAPPPPVVEDHSMFGEDAVILGSGVGGEFESFEAEDTGLVQREVTNARIYVGGQTQALLAWDAIPGLVDGVDADAMRLSPYEKHILQFVNGRRPVGRIRKKSGMEEPELKLALAMMADKGIITKVGVVDEERKARARARRRDKLSKSKRKKRRSTKPKRSSRADDNKDGDASRSDDAPKAKAKKADAAEADKASAKVPPSAKKELSKPPPRSKRAPPPSEATRVEAMPASLIDALRKGESVDGRAPDDDASKAGAPDATPTGDASSEGASKRKRRRPRLPPKMRRSLDSQAPLSEVSGLAEVSQPGASVPDRKPVLGGVEPTAIRKAPLADDDEDDVADVFSSSAEHAAALAAEGDGLYLDDPPPPAAAEPDDDELEPVSDVSTDTVPPLAPTAADEALPPAPSLAEDEYDEAAAGFETPDATVALDAENFSLDMPSIEVVDLAPGAPPPLPGDHSMAGDAVDDLHDLPTGPVHGLPPGPSVDDSLLPTGESPALAPAQARAAGLDFADDGGTPSATDADDVLSLPSGAIEPLPTFNPPAAELTPLPGMGVPPPADAPSAPPDDAQGDAQHDAQQDAAAIAAVLDEDDDEDDEDLLAIDDDEDDEDEDELAASAGAANEDDDDQEALADDSDEGEPVEVSFEMQRKAAKIFEQAEEDWSKNNRGSARMNAKLAMIYDPSNKQYKKTLAGWEQEAAAEPKQVGKLRQDVRLFEEARLAESRGQFEKACRLLQKALELNPRAAPVYNLLGVIQATRLKQYREASDNLLRACDLAPSNLSFKNNLGKVLGMQEGARDKSKIDRNDDDDMVKVRKIRPKFF